MQCSPKYQDGLWNDDDEAENKHIPELEEDNVKHSPLATLLRNTPLAFLAEYDIWFQDILKNCGNFDYFDIAKCFVHGREDLCEVFHCLSPTLGMEACPKNISGQLKYFAQKMCNYRSCIENFAYPIPPKLNSVFVQNAGKYLSVTNDYGYKNRTTLCILTLTITWNTLMPQE